MLNSKLMHILGCHPIVKTDIVRADDVYLFDKCDKKIIDFQSGIWCTALGHCNARINAIMIEQLGKIINVHYKLTNDVADTLAVNLLDCLNIKNGKAVFLSSGSEAVQLGMRISRLVSKGNKMLTFSTSYLSAYSNTTTPRNENLWIEIDFRKCLNCKNKKCSYACSLLKNIDFNDLSAFVLESASCGQVIFPPHKLVTFLAKEVKKHGGLIVANEVTTGFGRTGKWFGYNHYDIQPDIIALGKALGNGYPISAVAISKEVAAFVEMKKLRYTQSHQNDPLGCIIGNEVIHMLREDMIIDQSKGLGEFFVDQLKEIKNACSIVKNVRGRGLMLAIELNIENATEIIFDKMLQRGYFIGTNPVYNILHFFPALTISKDDILQMCQELKYQLQALENNI